MKMIFSLALTALVVIASLVPASLASFHASTTNPQTVQAAADWTAPVVSLAAPTGPRRGTVRLTATATDEHSSIDTVAVQLRAAGTQSWITRCTLTPPATTCDVPTGVYADGTYELRAVATDVHGNVGTSPILTRVFDNTVPTVSLTDPGAVLTGTVTLQATVADATSGVASARFQISPAGSGTWTELCAVDAAPYRCELDTRTRADGLYDLRVIATDHAGNTATSTVTARRIDNAPLSVFLQDVPDAVRGTVTLIADVTTTSQSAVTVVIQRRLAETTTWTTICTVSSAPYQCAWNTSSLAEGDWELRATATSSGASAVSPIVDTVVDNTVPTVSVQDPGSPISGSIDVRATAADATSGVASVTIQVAPQGTTNWTTICTDSAAPYSCRFASTSYPDGLYAFRAIAVDVAGNSRTSTVVGNRQIDNTISAVSLVDPGELLRGVVELQADATSTAGVARVVFEVRAAGTSGWTTLCTDTASPYTCTWDTRTVTDGVYDLRVVMTDGAGRITTSALVTARRVDNSPVSGVDVQTINRAGGTLGRLEAGDQLVLTYSHEMAPGSFIAGWDGSSRNVALRLRDGKLLTPAAGGKDDTIDLFTTTALTTPVNVGTVNTTQDHIKGGKVAVFNATLVTSTISIDGEPATVLTVTLGQLASGGGLRTAAAGTMIWSPSALARDVDGVASSTTPVTESGPLDRDF